MGHMHTILLPQSSLLKKTPPDGHAAMPIYPKLIPLQNPLVQPLAVGIF